MTIAQIVEILTSPEWEIVYSKRKGIRWAHKKNTSIWICLG